MTTVAIVNTDILAITNTIAIKYPELYIFLNEMPITIPIEINPSIRLKSLEEYYDSLVNMLYQYKLQKGNK